LELLVRARPRGCILDHFRLSTGGQKLLDSSAQLNIILPEECLSKYVLHYQLWARDVRRNMASSFWLDLVCAITANKVSVTLTASDELVPAEMILGALDSLKGVKMAALWFVVVAIPAKGMWLEHQSLPSSASIMYGKPAFVR
jgi:hypothetical protein